MVWGYLNTIFQSNELQCLLMFMFNNKIITVVSWHSDHCNLNLKKYLMFIYKKKNIFITFI